MIVTQFGDMNDSVQRHPRTPNTLEFFVLLSVSSPTNRRLLSREDTRIVFERLCGDGRGASPNIDIEWVAIAGEQNPVESEHLVKYKTAIGDWS